MNEVMDLHNTLARELLDYSGGHEADTEGDSFIVAFASPWDALEFAQVRDEWCCSRLNSFNLPPLGRSPCRA